MDESYFCVVLMREQAIHSNPGGAFVTNTPHVILPCTAFPTVERLLGLKFHREYGGGNSSLFWYRCRSLEFLCLYPEIIKHIKLFV